MQIVSLLKLPFRYKPWQPRHLQLIGKDLLGTKQPICEDRVHLEALVEWLCRAQDQRDGQQDEGSVSAGWSFEDGWLQGYPETSGYIVETFIAASEVLSRPELKTRANRILDWELSIQHADGAFPGHFGERGSEPVIFNTGQIMHGMLAGYLELGREECLEAAVKAGQWMRSKQDEDGCWRRSVHNGIPHTYNTRAAWALLRTGLAANDESLQQAAIKNLDWAISTQTPCGWFKQNAFLTDNPPFTHNIAYAIRGILESGLLLNDERYIKVASKSARALAQQLREDGWLAGAFSEGWQSKSYYCCLTGLAQASIIWQRLAQIDDDPLWLESAQKGIDFLKGTHTTTSTSALNSDAPHLGAIAGSFPIWGRYSMFEYPNWAAKFFADALLIKAYQRVVPAVDVPASSQSQDEKLAQAI